MLAMHHGHWVSRASLHGVTVDKYYLEMKKVQTFCMHTYAMCRLVSGSLLRYGHCVAILS